MDSLHLDGWQQYEWSLRNHDVTVLHCEPFRWSWFATKLVTFVFVIHDRPDSYASVLGDYNALRAFAREHKKTRIPISLQVGFALLPIYVGTDFSPELVSHVESTYKKRWCVMHIPSLYDTQRSTCHTLGVNYIWGCVYRDFVSSAIRSISQQLQPPRNAA